MNLYSIKSKANQILKAKKDFIEEFFETVNIFSTKKFFYFFYLNNIKYIHKDSLRMVYTNLDTFNYNEDTLSYCNINSDRTSYIIDYEKCLEILRTEHTLLPSIKESKYFMYYNFIEGTPVTSINKNDFYYLKKHSDFNSYTPFYNSMCYNIVRSNDKLYLVDFKHFEKIDKPFFIYMNNNDKKINDLYLEKCTSQYDVDIIIEHLNKDYVVSERNIVWID